jgi:hypothetical protein
MLEYGAIASLLAFHLMPNDEDEDDKGSVVYYLLTFHQTIK